VISGLLATSIFLMGCGGGAVRSGPLVRDSAGVEIVENSDYLWPEGQGWRLAEAPLLDIGSLEGDPEYQLFQIVGALRLDDGRLVVANAGSGELRLFDRAGTFRAAVGRKGGGPGEFEDLLWLEPFSGDSLFAFDWSQARASIFDTDGRFVRSFLLRPLTESGGFPSFAAPFRDGTLALGIELMFDTDHMSTGVRRDSVVYLHCSTEGATLDTIGRFPGAQAFVKTEGDRVIGGPLGLGRQPQAAAFGDVLYFGSSDSYEIRALSMDGSLRRLIRRDKPNLPVTAEDIERYKAEELAEWQDPVPRQALERMFDFMPFPETMPAYGEFQVDREGNLWVEEFRRPGDDQPRWTVFSSEGVMLGAVETPPRFEVYQIGSDFVLGRWRDELDVEHVQLYELVKD
jgi:hypothetical protein